jgi:tRNA U34 5-methylaminomethyl-2-thiouridine-forming methyltransferase MnmC
MHPGLGPAQEAELLYVQQLKLRERMRDHSGEFLVWDVGLGAAANALTLLRLTQDIVCPVRIFSFDDTCGPLEFALQHTNELHYFTNYDTVAWDLLTQRQIEFTDGLRSVKWEFLLSDFPSTLANWSADRSVAPHAILFDAFSPAKNPAMWTLPLFTNLFRQLDPARPCNLTTYSRSTMFRVTLLLAGFFVGRGVPTGLKEETTVAANTLDLIGEPLDHRWLERAQRSDSAQPLSGPEYRRLPLSPEICQRLQNHPQFA